MNRPRVLLLGSHEWPALSVARSLGRAGFHVETLRLTEHKQPSDYSRFVRRSHWVGDPHAAFIAWRDRFTTLLSGGDFDLLFPINDVANEIVYNVSRGDLPARVTVVGPTRDAWLRAVDKIEASRLFEDTVVRLPYGRVLRALGDVEAGLRELEYPVYVKPARSAHLVAGRIQTFRVSVAHDERALRQKLSEDLPRLAVSIQQPIEGHGVGVNLVALDGRIVGLSQNERLHEPFGGGGSSYRRNVQVDPELAGVADHVARTLRWTGLMMIELKRSGGDWWFMELNCRPWGSIETAIRSGVDFPLLAVECARGHAAETGEPVSSSVPTHVRNLKKDIKWFANRIARSPTRFADAARWVTGFGRVFAGRESWDVESLSDPLPALAQFNNDLVRLGTRVTAWGRRAALGLRPRPKVRLSRTDRVLFVCAGNINRSVVAETLARSIGLEHVASAGTLPLSGRAASPDARAFLAALDLSAEEHRSRQLLDTEVEAEAADRIVVFDRRNWVDVRRAMPGLDQRLVFLDQISDAGVGEILDPFGHDAGAQRACFEKIASALGALRVSSSEAS